MLPHYVNIKLLMCGPHKVECDACVTRVHGSDLVLFCLCHLFDRTLDYFIAMTTLQEKHTDLAPSETTVDELLTIKHQFHIRSMCF